MAVIVENVITATTSPFTITDLERICPGVSRDMLRQVLPKLKDAVRWNRSDVGRAHNGKERVIPPKRGKNKGKIIAGNER